MSLPPLAAEFPPVCISVAAATPHELWTAAEAALCDSRFLELRLDALPDPAAAIPQLQSWCVTHPEAILLATCRRNAGGGHYSGSVDQQLTLLAHCAQAGASLLDLELESLEVASPSTLQQWSAQLPPTTRLLVSAHDYTGTSDLDATLGRLRTLGAPARASIYKVVTTAQSLSDNLRVLHFLETTAKQLPLLALCMGQAGIPSRILGPRAGAAFTFAANGQATTAPGQLSAHSLLTQFRLAQLTPATQIYGVAGNPVHHSLSPALHNAAFQSARLDAVYLPLHTTSVPDLLQLTRALPLQGLSVTMPYKIQILPFLDHIDPLARRIGAVNTVLRQPDGSLHGFNSDAAAVVEPLTARLPLPGARVLILGAGGAARAAAFGLVAAGAKVFIWSRRHEAAQQLAQACGATATTLPANASSWNTPWDVVVQATPAGMAGQPASTLPAAVLHGVQVLFEMVYRPAETPLVRTARSLGIEVITGIEMFVHQGVRQWELWTGQTAPRATMQAAVASALAAEQAEPPTPAPDPKESSHGKI